MGPSIARANERTVGAAAAASAWKTHKSIVPSYVLSDCVKRFWLYELTVDFRFIVTNKAYTLEDRDGVDVVTCMIEL